MTVEIRELYYYLMEGPATNPDLSLFTQDSRIYQVQGALDGTQLQTNSTFINYTNTYAISGQSANSNTQYVNDVAWFLVDGHEFGIFVPKTNLTSIGGVKSADTGVITTCIFEITTN